MKKSVETPWSVWELLPPDSKLSIITIMPKGWRPPESDWSGIETVEEISRLMRKPTKQRLPK